MWKVQDFSATQFLREINFLAGFGTQKSAIFSFLEPLYLVILVHFNLPKSAKIHKNHTSEPLNVLQWQF